ncbi:response regulator [Desulfovibrio sp. DV]|uniref:response regulator n=1 Tax=Desulfovibrio sp. DV TaxID=1844708 RepID=UPI00094BBCD5|nr:response regulator [Desulfovibrio sp. DV]
MSKVLLIDRDVSQGNMIADILKTSSQEIVFVHSVDEAIAIFHREQFDLIFLDVAPEKNALAAVQGVIKGVEDILKKRVPFIVLAKSFSESASLLDTTGVDVLLEIPAHSEQLKPIVEQFVGCKIK